MAIGTAAELRGVIARTVPAERRAAILALERPAMELAGPDPVPPAEPCSRLGGIPLGAADAAYPMSEDGPLDLLARVDLAELARDWPDSPLPDHGALHFYCDTEDPPWSYIDSDPARWRVVWDTTGQPRPVRPPAGHRPLPARRIAWTPAACYPSTTEDDSAFDHVNLPRDLAAIDVRGPVHDRLLGWPHLLQGSVTTLCQRESAYHSGEEHLTAERTLSTEEYDALVEATRAADWRLLLQLGSTRDRAFGGGGGLYFLIRAADLAAARFDRVWAVTQD